MKSIWNGAIGLGLVNIPVKMYSATESSTLDEKSNLFTNDIYMNVFVKQYEQKSNLFGLCRCEKTTNFNEYF